MGHRNTKIANTVKSSSRTAKKSGKEEKRNHDRVHYGTYSILFQTVTMHEWRQRQYDKCKRGKTKDVGRAIRMFIDNADRIRRRCKDGTRGGKRESGYERIQRVDAPRGDENAKELAGGWMDGSRSRRNTV